MPDDEERQMLENNIQVALGQGLIELDDAIDLRDVRNIKLANQLLKVKRKKKAERDQQMQQQNIQAQSQANQQAQAAAAQAEVQKNQAKTQSEAQLEQTKNELKMQYLEREAEVKKELMRLEYELSMGLKGAEDDRKDIREDKKLETQKQIKEGETVKKFESSGNDVLTGGAGMSKFGM